MLKRKLTQLTSQQLSQQSAVVDSNNDNTGTQQQHKTNHKTSKNDKTNTDGNNTTEQPKYVTCNMCVNKIYIVYCCVLYICDMMFSNLADFSESIL